MASENISLICTTTQLDNLLKKIKDLTSINSRIVIRIEKNNILLFSFVGDTFKDIHAFKNYIFQFDQIFTIKKGEIENPIFFISKNGKSLYRKLENFLDYENEIKCKISIDTDDQCVNFINFSNSKLDIKIIGGDPLIVGSEISIDDINFLMDIDKSLFNFRLNRIDFLKIKKIGAIENELKSVLNLNINNKILSLGETKWKLNITDIDYDDISFSFPKSYFNTINSTDFIDIYAFDGFILCKYDDYNLMIILETTI